MAAVGLTTALGAIGLLGTAAGPAAALAAPVEPVQVVARAVTFPGGITAGPDGNLWFASSGNDTIGRITPSGVITSFSGPGISTPDSITSGPDGNLWFTESHGGSIGRITPAGVVTSFPDTAIHHPEGIAAGPDGNLWFANGVTSIGRITPAGLLSTFNRPDMGPTAMTAGPGGNIWFASRGNLVGFVTPGRSGGIVGYYGDPRFADGYTPLTPARILDSRPTGPQVGPYGTPWGAGQTRDVTVAGIGGLPAGADAVVVNVTVTATTAAGYLTIWPSGFGQPLASSLNWRAGQTVSNAVTVKVGSGGTISVLNPVGSAHVIIDVVGSFSPGSGALFHPLSPARIQDSRPAGPQVGPYSTPWGAATTRTVQVSGAGGVPAGAAAALLNVTATVTTASSYLTVAPAGEAPLASSLNWQAGQTVANAAPAKLSPGGAVSVKNAAGQVDVLADASGWYG